VETFIDQALAAVLCVALALAACGGSSKSSGSGGSSATSASAASSQADPNGVLKIAADFTSAGGLHLDPSQNLNPSTSACSI
jgi:ABC-type glycerol-3-phosphate transport system substrate-binding protein